MPRGLRSRARGRLVGAERRIVDAWWPVTLTAAAAVLAWWLSHEVLGHSRPFFAPIASAIALSTARAGRGTRSLQLLLGVALGITVGELLHGAVGSPTAALGPVVAVAMLAAVALGEGVIGQGQMFVNQAAASAILVTVLEGTAGERLFDAAVGGTSALLIGVVLFPSLPLPKLRSAEEGVLAALATALRALASSLRDGRDSSPDWTAASARSIHAALEHLDTARRRTAPAPVRVRWRVRVRTPTPACSAMQPGAVRSGSYSCSQ